MTNQLFPSLPARNWVQTNDTDVIRQKTQVLSNLYYTFNIDTEEVEGTIRLGKRLLVNTNSADVAQLNGVPVGFKMLNGKIYTAAGAGGTGFVFNSSANSPSSSPFAKNTASGGVTAPSTVDSLYSDLEILNGQLFVTMKDLNVYYMSQNSDTTWATFSFAGGGVDSNPHLLAAYGGRMYCTYNGNKIISWDSSATPSVATLGARFTIDLTSLLTGSSVISFIRPASDRIWIGTLNTKGGRSYVYSWNGSSGSLTSSYRLDTSGAVACVIKDEVPYITDVMGNLLMWNGGTFVKVAGLNLLNTRYLFNPNSIATNRFIHPNGMEVIKGRVCSLLDLRNYDGAYGASGAFPDSFTIGRHMPSGVYQYNKDTGSYNHIYSIGLTHPTDTIVDYGQFYLASTTTTGAVGALAQLIVTPGGSGNDGSFLAGAGFSNDASSASGNNWAILYDNLLDTKQKAAYFVTMKVPSSGVMDIWQKVYLITKKLQNSTDKMVLKFRTDDVASVSAVLTCTASSGGSSTLTSSNDLSTVLVGDEIEVISGQNAGICSHITAISLNAGTYTITVDETFAVSNPHTSRAFIQRWTKSSPMLNDQVTNNAEMGLGPTSTWIQFKLWMLGTGKNEVQALLIASTAKKKVE